MPKTDREFLHWIYERMKNVHNENPNTDYMRRLEYLSADRPLFRKRPKFHAFNCGACKSQILVADSMFAGCGTGIVINCPHCNEKTGCTKPQ